MGCASAKEVIDAVAKAVLDAKKHFIAVPLTRSFSFPHRIDGIAGAAKVMLRPASEGTGVIAGGAVRVVLELAGIKNAFGKQLGSGNPLNNARATVDGLARQRTLQMVADERGLTMEELIGRQGAPRRPADAAPAPARSVCVPLRLSAMRTTVSTRAERAACRERRAGPNGGEPCSGGGRCGGVSLAAACEPCLIHRTCLHLACCVPRPGPTRQAPAALLRLRACCCAM